jgi:hypothetical protein
MPLNTHPHMLTFAESRTELERLGVQIVPIMTQAMVHVIIAVGLRHIHRDFSQWYKGFPLAN